MKISAGITAFLVILIPAVGLGQVVDGDTLTAGNRKWRLWGIDSFEIHQTCNGWPAGRMAREFLADQIRNRNISCEFRASDRYGRAVGLCRADGADLSAVMVRAGLAYAYVRYSQDYVQDEDAARAGGVGGHFFKCEAPWAWRRNR